MTRQEAESKQREIKLTCKGAWKAKSDTVLEKAFERIKKTITSEQKEDFEKLEPGRQMKTTQDFVIRLLEIGMPAEAQALERAGRVQCGQSINDIICAGNFDGERHEYQCPKCGVKGIYYAPFFSEEVVEPEKAKV